MHFAYLATAFFATIALGAPAAVPTDIGASLTVTGEVVPTPSSTIQPIPFTVPLGQGVPIPQACCINCTWKGCKVGCGKKYCGK